MTRVLSPHVRWLIQTSAQASGKTVVATENGVWELDNSGIEFRRLPAKNLPNTVSYVSSTATGSLLAIAGGELWSDGDGSGWKSVATPPRANGLLWVKESPLSRDQFLLGTQHGVFVSGPGGDWRMLSNGLPAIASEAPAFSGTRCLLAMSNGGLYESLDGLSTWRRADTDEERGKVNALLATDGATFLVASEQEGLLLGPPAEKGERSVHRRDAVHCPRQQLLGWKTSWRLSRDSLP